MAWYTFVCPTHAEFIQSLPKRKKVVKCPKCGTDSSAIIKTGTAQIVERLDNGLMARAVERLHNIEDIITKRSNDNDRINDAMEFAGQTEKDEVED